MRSRTVQPVKRREQSKSMRGRKKKNAIGDTQPIKVSSHTQPLRASSDTQPIRIPSGQRKTRSASYRGRYQQAVSRRRKEISVPKPEAQLEKKVKKKQSSVTGALLGTRAKGKETNAVQYFDYDLLLAIVFLMCFGLVMLYSTSAYSAQADFGNDMYYFSKQALIGAVSFVGMMIVSKIDYHFYGAFSFELYIFAMILMALVQTPLGVTIYGARRWIQLPGNMTLQPSEITKIAVILFLSYELCRIGKKINTRAGILRVFAFGAVAAGGVMFLTDNLSTAIIVMAISCILIFIVHPKTKPFIAIAAGVAAVFAVAVMVMSVTLVNSDNFRLRRILTWLDPENHSDTGGFQVMQGLYAIGSGGFFGKGLGNSTQKLGVIPEAQNDMILTVICEELGVFGAIVILLLFGFLLYRLMFIARNAPDLYGALIASGIFVHIALQVILNIAVVTNLIPTTGITLPFISYGGTSILFLMTEMGIALGISRRIKLED
ncbi:cell division protein FtsW [Mediterraneibacter sp. NSJ-55]|uniref:Probable peptidoglycan glycosyltransferase FtsW n=1 Tax=Mediterraneibacter hominis TaxID=2763054 RepID=A0A923RPF6_9FIRM|nr:putative peptidoglycan glycosyltransferase FtsW [Mediterraneibacter hominis]MBC5687558.1 cell division protein FtsW [Mediterraneibacter hominis]